MFHTIDQAAVQFLMGNKFASVHDVTHALDYISQELDHEICEALLEENNGLAERLNRSFVLVKKLSNSLKQSQ